MNFIEARPTSWPRKGKARDLVIYSDKPSKMDSGEDRRLCVHVELKTMNAAAVKGLGLKSVEDVIALNPRRLFNWWIKIVDFDPEKFKQPIIRRSVKAERRAFSDRRDKAVHPFTENYRATIARRADDLLKHLYHDRVQLIRDAHENDNRSTRMGVVTCRRLRLHVVWALTGRAGLIAALVVLAGVHRGII